MLIEEVKIIMHIIYCDGSLKKDNKVVIGLIVVQVDPIHHSIREIVFAYKNVFLVNENEKKDNIHETLALLEALKIANALEYNSVLIINDSIADIQYFQQLQENKVNIHQKTQNKDVLSLYSEVINRLNNKTDNFQRLPRTCLGLNIADYLNKETDSWTNSKDKPYLQLQFKKFLRRNYDYDISSKNKKLRM